MFTFWITFTSNLSLQIIKVGDNFTFFKLDLVYGKPRIIDLENYNEAINNSKLVKCDDKEFVCTVDYGGNVRMLFLENLFEKECIKLKNVF